MALCTGKHSKNPSSKTQASHVPSQICMLKHAFDVVHPLAKVCEVCMLVLIAGTDDMPKRHGKMARLCEVTPCIGSRVDVAMIRTRFFF